MYTSLLYSIADSSHASLSKLGHSLYYSRLPGNVPTLDGGILSYTGSEHTLLVQPL